jgi:hypothetical protein
VQADEEPEYLDTSMDEDRGRVDRKQEEALESDKPELG